MLDRQELYRRLDTIVPGEAQADNHELYCERLSMEALNELHRYSTDPRLYEFFEFSPFVDLTQTREYFEKLQDRMGLEADGRTAMYWVVRRKADHYLVGTMNLIFLDYKRQSVEWGYGLDPELWGHGYVLQIQEMLKEFVFEVLELNRLQGMTMDGNERTVASVVAAGLTHEGTLRDYYCKDCVYRDALVFGVLADDYVSQLKRQAGGPVSALTIKDIVAIVSDVLADADVDEDSTMPTTPSWDSLNHMAIMEAVSKRTGVRLSPSDVTNANSVRAILAILNSSRQPA